MRDREIDRWREIERETEQIPMALCGELQTPFKGRRRRQGERDRERRKKGKRNIEI